MKYLLPFFCCLFLLKTPAHSQLPGPDSAHLIRGPYLLVTSKTAITIRWRTDKLAASVVSLGLNPGIYTQNVTDNTAVTEHVQRVSGLQPGTKYYYRIGTLLSSLQGDTDNFFTTAPPDNSIHKVTIAAFGDCGRNDNGYQSGALGSYQRFLASQGRKAADLMLLLGDNAYQAGTEQEYSDNFFAPYAGILKNHPLFPCPGNHDYANDPLRQADHQVPYYGIFSMPQNGECGGVSSGTKAYYSFNWGNIHFLSMDSYGLEDSGTTRIYDTVGAQVTWMKADLAANTKRWTIAYWHHPPYTLGSHNSDLEQALISVRHHLIGILERNGVDLIICAHSHDYERSYLLRGYSGDEAAFNKAANTADSSSARYDGSPHSCPYTTVSGKIDHGTVYVVSGSAGADGAIQAGWPHNALPFAQDDGGMLYLEIEDNRLDARFIRRDSVIADQFSIFKDVNRRDTMVVPPHDTVMLHASWIGTYLWSGGNTNRNRIVIPAHDTVITVCDSAVRTCLTDRFVIRLTTDTFATSVGKLQNGSGTYVYPVPATNTLYLQIRPAADAMYTFRFYDVRSRLLRTSYRRLSAGAQDLSFDIRDLPAGQTLMLEVFTGAASQMLRFIRKE